MNICILQPINSSVCQKIFRRMKHNIRFFIPMLLLMVFCMTSFGENAPRQRVIVEIGTGVWCGFCPGAAMGAADLIANGHSVAVIKYHVGDVFSTTQSSARTSYYNIQGYPTTVFDGVLTHVGGDPNNSIYPAYLPLYNQRINEPSPFTIALNVEHIKDSEYEAHVVVTNVAGFSSGNLVLHLAVTETDIPYSWLNQTHVKDVLRKMVPDQFGTPLDFSADTSIETSLPFTTEPAWVEGNMHVVAFVQDVPSREIFQGEIVPLVSEEEPVLEYTLNFAVEDAIGQSLEDAAITLEGAEYEPGTYVFEDLEPGIYTYLVTKECYLPLAGEVHITDSDKFVTLTLDNLQGDVNNDVVVDVLDVAFLVDYFLHGEPVPVCYNNADIDHNGTINVLDAIGIIAIIMENGTGNGL